MFVGEGGIAEGSSGEGEEKEEGGKLLLGFGLWERTHNGDPQNL